VVFDYNMAFDRPVKAVGKDRGAYAWLGHTQARGRPTALPAERLSAEGENRRHPTSRADHGGSGIAPFAFVP
jgi:hypothetical protein